MNSFFYDSVHSIWNDVTNNNNNNDLSLFWEWESTAAWNHTASNNDIVDILVGNGTNNLNNQTSRFIESNASLILRNTLSFYGGFFVLFMFVYCIVRRRLPNIYNLRGTIPKFHTFLAEDQFGFISWSWKVLFVTERDILHESGMDCLCFDRTLYLGIKLSILGMINSLWLLPLYANAPVSKETAYIQDPVTKLSISHVPSSSSRLLGTVLAAYVIYGFAMHWILKELEWFAEKRHEFIKRATPRNYTVFVRGILSEYRTNHGLANYFRRCLCHESDNHDHLQAMIVLQVPMLSKLVGARARVVANLEHAMGYEKLMGVPAMHRDIFGNNNGAMVNSIQVYFDELKALNKDITRRIDEIYKQQAEQAAAAAADDSITEEIEEIAMESERGGGILLNSSFRDNNIQMLERASSERGDKKLPAARRRDPHQVGNYDMFENELQAPLRGHNADESEAGESRSSSMPSTSERSFLAEALVATGSAMISTTNQLLSAGNDSVNRLTSTAVSLVLGPEDGEPYDAGFVTFTSLRTVHSALQMIHHRSPFVMEVSEAPDPEDIIWASVGKTHEQLHVGMLSSFAFTTVILTFWTIPISFIASLSAVDTLKAEIHWIAYAVNKYPWLQPLLAQLAPMLIVAANELLPIILMGVSFLEWPLSLALLQASMFDKIAAFMIIQTFFVSAISGSFFNIISNFLRNPNANQVIALLANSLPSRSIYFIQIILVNTFVSMGWELLRGTAICLATLRKMIGPNLTDKEKNSKWMYIRPFADPPSFYHSYWLAMNALYYVVFFVYTTIAPITNFFMALCFLLLMIGFRHQFFFVYPHRMDSGGKMYISFIYVALSCMMIGQITLLGLLGLKKAIYAGPLVIPLLIVTILFIIYIRQRHFLVAKHLPTRDCLKEDLERRRHRLNFQNEYIQPELRDRELYPDDVDELMASLREQQEENNEENNNRNASQTLETYTAAALAENEVI